VVICSSTAVETPHLGRGCCPIAARRAKTSINRVAKRASAGATGLLIFSLVMLSQQLPFAVLEPFYSVRRSLNTVLLLQSV
jgi:hypothetical protein